MTVRIQYPRLHHGLLKLGFGLGLATLTSSGCDDGGRESDGQIVSGGVAEQSGGAGGDDMGTTAADTLPDLSLDGDASSMTQGGTGAGDGGTTGGDMDTPCVEVRLVGEIKPPNVLLVLDKSGSMKTLWEDGQSGEQIDRWTSLYDTVDFMLTNYMQRMSFAVKLFPGRDAEEVGPAACIVDNAIDVRFGSQNKFQILSRIPAKDDEFEGGTPAVTALQHSVDYMRQVKELDELKLPQAIVLVMDGRVSCDETMVQMRELASAAAADEIPIYVVGVDIANDPSDPGLPAEMDQLAAAGGTTQHYASNNQEQLREAMEQIVGKITDCRFELTEKPMDPSKGQLKINGTPIALNHTVRSCEEAAAIGQPDAWIFTDDSFLNVEICGASCDLFADVGSADTFFPCPPPM